MRVVLFLFAACWSSLVGLGQTGLTVDQCISIARQRSLTLKSVANQARSAGLARDELATTRLPQVKLGGHAIYAPTANQFGYDPAISNGGEYAAQLIVQQSVYDGGVRSLRDDQMAIDLDLQQTDMRRSDRDLVLAVRLGFIDVLLASRNAELASESMHQLGEYHDLVVRLAGGGSASSTDVLKTEVQVANARLDLQRAEEAIEASTIVLKQTMGLPQDTLLAIAGNLQGFSIGANDSSVLSALEHPAGGLDLLYATKEIEKNAIEVEAAKRETNPSVSLVADAGLVTSGDNLRLPRDERDPVIGFSVGVSVELPLLTWGGADLRVQQKELAAENMRLEREELTRSLDARARTLRLQLVNALRRRAMAQQIIERAEGNFLLTKAKYASGSALSLEVLDAQHLLSESKTTESQAYADVEMLLARIDHLLTH